MIGCRHERAWLAALLGAAVLLRVLLVVWSPTPFGYVWDYYYNGVQVLYDRGRLPVASDCWQCYHPPLYYLLGWPLYAAGRAIGQGSDATGLRWLGLLPLACGAAATYFGYRLLRLFHRRGVELVMGTGLLLTFPCLFISSYGAEADIVVTALLSALIFYLVRDAGGGPPGLAEAARIGVLAGLAAATKYSGLVGVATAAVVLAWHAVPSPRRFVALQGLGLVLVLTGLIGGWKYVDNLRWHGTPLHANGSAAQSFSLERGAATGRYEFWSLRLGELMATVRDEAPPGRLTDLPVYRSVPATLHGLAWSDLGFFSDPTRHGDPAQPYPRKRVFSAITVGVLLLAFVPDALAMMGAGLTLRRRRFLPLVIFCVLSLGSYAWWFVAQAEWGLKTKYILFLLSPFILYVTIGLGWVRQRAPRMVSRAVTAVLGTLLVLLHMYLLMFAVG